MRQFNVDENMSGSAEVRVAVWARRKRTESRCFLVVAELGAMLMLDVVELMLDEEEEWRRGERRRLERQRQEGGVKTAFCFMVEGTSMC